jgi:hypothetical protein
LQQPQSEVAFLFRHRFWKTPEEAKAMADWLEPQIPEITRGYLRAEAAHLAA